VSHPSSLSDVPADLAEEFDRRCTAHEAAVRNGDRPCLEAILEGLRGHYYRLLLRHALGLDLELRRGAGEAPAEHDYLGRFGEDDVVAEVFAEGPSVPVVAGAAQAPLPRVPGFEVLGVLGRGGMGIVYRARHPGLGREVALKTIKDGWGGAEALARARDEAKALAQFNDPRIVQVYDVGEQDGRPFLALEYVPGEDLARRLGRGPLPPAEAARLVETLACALHVVHGRGLVHRDLKPANILLDGTGAPKITDFGLVKHLDTGQGRTLSGAVVGTPSYMAPEQARGGSKAAGVPADVYSLGAILYECLTGRPPFRAASPLDTLFQVINDEPLSPRQLNRKVDSGLAWICLKCLEKDPAYRYSSAADLAADLRRWLEGEPLVPLPWWLWLWRQFRSPCRIDRPGEWARLLSLFSVWSLFGHGVMALLLRFGPSPAACWLWFVGLEAGAWLPVLPLVRSARRLDSTERGMLLNWLACIASDALLFALFCSPWQQTAPQEIVRVYPVWLTVHGLMWVMEARPYWGRFYALGLGYLLAVPLVSYCGLLAPLAFGLVNVTGLLWVAFGLRRLAAERREQPPAASPAGREEPRPARQHG
jgi:serine/threonine-protein kinase